MRLDFVSRAAFLFAATCAPVFAATHVIVVGLDGSFMFSPATQTIPAGDTITFQNTSGITHNVVSDDGITFSSPTSGTFTFVTNPLPAGTIGFHCSIHG
jgi:plastocyanin